MSSLLQALLIKLIPQCLVREKVWRKEDSALVKENWIRDHLEK